jgi:2'-5' RNA ligase
VYYLLINSLKGDIAKYHNQLVDDVADRFDLRIEQEINVPAHFTLKYWFTANDTELSALKADLADFCRSHQRSPVRLGGFDGFPPNAVFIDVVLSENALETYSNLIAGLKTLKWMEWDQYDYPNLRFHTTIAEECKEKYDDVCDYLAGKEKYFDCWFDNITLIGIDNLERQISRIEVLDIFQMNK